MISIKEERDRSGPDPIEEFIMGASTKEYEQARDFYGLITSRSAARVPSDIEVGTGAEAQKQAWDALRVSVRGDPRWASLFLVASLVLARSFAVAFDPNDVRATLQRYAKDNISS